MSSPLYADKQIETWTREARARHAAEIEALKPIARTLAAEAGPAGVTVGDLRHVAGERGLLPTTPKGRQLSYLGAVMRAAGLVATDRVRRSTVERSHGNRHTIWVLPGFSGVDEVRAELLTSEGQSL